MVRDVTAIAALEPITRESFQKSMGENGVSESRSTRELTRQVYPWSERLPKLQGFHAGLVKLLAAPAGFSVL
jgi:hypothetical protein